MSTRQGNKKYYQLLLDKNRAELLETLATFNNQRATAWARDAIYQRLERECGVSIYQTSKDLDDAEWKQSTLNRAKGRKKAKEARSDKDT